MANLSKNLLFEKVLESIVSAGWKYIIIENTHPYLVKLIHDDYISGLIRIYIWNCTHGGGWARASDEYRIQVTGATLNKKEGETTLLLGWHLGYEAFVGFDIDFHYQQRSSSPSMQVKEDYLNRAHKEGMSLYKRSNGEIVVCFDPTYLCDYIKNINSFHKFTGVRGELNAASTAISKISSEQEKEKALKIIRAKKRVEFIRNIRQKSREYDFRSRVLTAYGNRCCMCGVQLKLVEAAHILPVAVQGSTDETKNGVALCSIHHKAYDNNLISFDDSYRIEISQNQIKRIGSLNFLGGYKEFKTNLKAAILLPADCRDYPDKEYINNSREKRGWKR